MRATFSLEGELSPAARRIDRVLSEFLSTPNRRSLFRSAGKRCDLDPANLREHEAARLAEAMKAGLRIFATDPKAVEALEGLFGSAGDSAEESRDQAPATRRTRPASERAEREKGHHVPRTHEIEIEVEDDIMRARGLAKDVCGDLNVSRMATTKIVTVVSELARNIFQYACPGVLRVATVETPRRGVEVLARDQGSGIEDLDAILTGRYRSKSGMGAGIRGTRALADEFDIDTGPRGTRIRFVMYT